jgi:hypothetical protein
MADPVFGFKESTSRQLLALVGKTSAATESRSDPNTYTTNIRFAKTVATITAGGSGQVYEYDRIGSSPGWSVTTNEQTAWSPFATIASDTNVILFPINGRWVAFEVC